MEECALKLPIKLSQFLKVVNWAESGGEAHSLIKSGLVYINDEVELRPAHSLQAGDVVSLPDSALTMRIVER